MTIVADVLRLRLVADCNEKTATMGGTPANFSGCAPRQCPLMLAAVLQLLAAISGGYRTNVRGGTLLTRVGNGSK